MGVQISCGIHPEVSAEVAVSGAAFALGGDVSRVDAATGIGGGGRAPVGGSCAHAFVDSTKVVSVAGDGVHQGKECNSHCPDVRGQAAELHRATLLGAR